MDEMKHSTNYTSLLIHQSKYLDNVEEVIYKIKDVYDTDKCEKMTEVEHSKQRISGTFNFRPIETNFNTYAYGLLVSLFKTRLIPIDIDRPITIDDRDHIIQLLSKIEVIDGIDLVHSSPEHSHLYIGLNVHTNISNFLMNFPVSMCSNYRTQFLFKGAQIIRVSEKFMRSDPACPYFKCSAIKPIECIRYNKDRELIAYKNNQILPPLISIKTNTPNNQSKKTIKLRD